MYTSPMQSKLDIALLTLPFDMLCAVVAFGADRAFTWTGSEPKSREEFFFECGKMLEHLKEQAWEKELSRVGRYPRS